MVQDMRLDDMVESKYFKKEDVEAAPIVGIVQGFRKENLAMDGQPPQYKWLLEFTNLDKAMVLGPTTIEQLKEALGADTQAECIGQRVELFCDPSVMMRGKKVGGVRLRAPTARPARRPPPPDGGGHEAEEPPPLTARRSTVDQLDDDIPF